MSVRGMTWLLLVLAGAPAAEAFGPAGHRIVGHIAEARLCTGAEEAIRVLGGSEGLDEIGLWADRARRERAWSHTAPWHYMNIDDGGVLAAYEHPPEGDVLWAIAHFTEQLQAFGLPLTERAEALRFLVHFVADLHQPLHVGRASDRGGNRIEVTVDGATLNLHRFWDTEVIALDGLSVRHYTARYVEPLARAHEESWAAQPMLEWAQESFELRAFVYDFGESGELDARYRADARRVIIERLAQAGVRLAATLNAIFCIER